MRRIVGGSFAVFLALAGAAAASGQEAGLAEDSSAIVVQDELDLVLQELYVTVEDRRGRRVLDLDADDFRIVDGGEERPIVTFERGEVPFTAALVIDGSDSMRGHRLDAALAGAGVFASAMGPYDEARLLVFSDRLLGVSPTVGHAEPLEAALEGVDARGGTAIYDHLFLAITALEGRLGRRVVVLLSDGYDAHSLLSVEDLRTVARRGRAILYWLRLVGHEDEPERSFPRTPWRTSKEAKRDFEVLEKTVRETGGRIVDITGPAEMEGAFREVLAELREQYVIGYYPPPDAGFREVRLELTRRGLVPRWRNGTVEH